MTSYLSFFHWSVKTIRNSELKKINPRGHFESDVWCKNCRIANGWMEKLEGRQACQRSGFFGFIQKTLFHRKNASLFSIPYSAVKKSNVALKYAKPFIRRSSRHIFSSQLSMKNTRTPAGEASFRQGSISMHNNDGIQISKARDGMGWDGIG